MDIIDLGLEGTPEEDQHPFTITHHQGVTYGAVVLSEPRIEATCKDCGWITVRKINPSSRQRTLKLNLKHDCVPKTY